MALANKCAVLFCVSHRIIGSLATPTLQGDRMSVYYLVALHNPAIKTFSRCWGFIKQRFCLPTRLSFVGSFRSMLRAMCR